MPDDFRIGSWLVEPSLNSVTCNGKVHRLEPKMMEVLVYLAQNQRVVVSKEQLMRVVWPDTFVTDDVLTRCVSELRKALEDDAKEPRVIQTIPKRGYRLLVKVEPVNPPSPRSHITYIYIGAAILLSLCISAFVSILWMARQTAAPVIASTEQITFTAEGKLAPILTDGLRLFFDQGGLVQMSVSGGEVVPIRSSLGGLSALDVSPDGSDLLVVKRDGFDESGRGYLYVLPILGGSPRRIGAIYTSDARWSPDGESILYCDGRSLYVVNSAGTNPRKIWEAASAIEAPVYSPDRRKIRVTVYGVNQWQSRKIWELDADGRNAHPITPDWPAEAGEYWGQWSPDGKHYVFLSNRDDKTDVFELVPPSFLTLFKAPVPVKLTQSALEISSVSPSRDGTRLFVIGSADQGAMVAYDPKAKRFVPFLGGMTAAMIEVSPDGQWIAYKTYPQESIWKCRVDGTERVQLVASGSIPRWSPDGKKIVFHAWFPKGPKLFVVPAEGGNVEEVVPGASNEDPNQMSGSWGADGESVTYGEYPNPGTSAKGIHVWNFRTHTGSILPGSEGYHSPAWSPDGKWLIAVHDSPNHFMLYSPVAKAWTDFGENPKDSNWWVWSRDSKSIYYTASDGIYRIPLSTGKSEFFASFKNVKVMPERVISMTPNDMPAVMSDASVQQIYSLEWKK